MKTPGSMGRAARRRGIVLAMIFLLMPGVAGAKIIQNQEKDGPSADAPLTIQPDAPRPPVDYYLFGSLPGWWNQSGVASGRWPSLMPAIGTATITRRILHDAVALRLARQAEKGAFFTNSPRSWRHGKFRGTVLMLRSFRNQAGLLCRDFSHTVTIDAVDSSLAGTACRQGDGTWLLAGENGGPL